MIFNRHRTLMSAARVSLLALGMALSAQAAEPAKPWLDAHLSPDVRASLLNAAMTNDERLSFLHGPMALPILGGKIPDGAIGSAGYYPPIPRLGIPALQESDASLGVTNPLGIRPGDHATALPSGLALAATFNPDIAFAGGVVVGNEARHKKINVQLAGGANLARDPRNGRNFEYVGEDPWLAGMMAGEQIRGIQSEGVISTVKHFALNDQETGRNFANSVIDEAALRESDLLAFQIAIEKGQPGSVMCAYSLVNGAYACGHDWLLNKVLKGDWGYKGWVMSDWGAVKSTDFALLGLDQQSGEQLDKQVWFGEPLKAAVASRTVPQARIEDMNRRILRSMFAAGLFDTPEPVGEIDYAAHAEVAARQAAEGMVLLKNTPGLLPLAGTVKKILVIGGHADAGVASGGGSSQVLAGEGQLIVPLGGEGMLAMFRNANFHPSSPLKALRERLPEAEIRFYDGRYDAEAARLAKMADVVIVFGLQWMGENEDAPDLSLPNGQDHLISAVTAANPNTIVVLETGGPVLMPWLDKAGAVIEAWYPGQKGGEVIADIVTGKVNPSGRLPVTFPASLDQYPRVALPGLDVPDGQIFDVVYEEGADVGYRRFAKTGAKPLFPFGFGLSYTQFSYTDLKVTGGQTVSVSFTVTNTGKLSGKDTPQVYLSHTPGAKIQRLIGFSKVDLMPGQSQTVTLTADPRLLASFNLKTNRWDIAGGNYTVTVASSAGDEGIVGETRATKRSLKP
ncbi:beta-glucosidase family protein [Asticcacaulis benevestitus]|uniref:Fibronectin type III-like domain-containing protein n=1 Tax=Asticcacaulis benevestitus DSM 16100 = ATCC BAA-896 TaxID=1121022 RepID=V4RBA3_9CAUL|nr:glycoside hydrolase family 3 C-terminal domain-containing protein [Asticcacaulis benevestitus]ESQ88693.1 hypothetical protein ABENE_15740 [Asticcacaulis benevestitus DSM 16100 = ATCC BAA-896]